MARRKQYECPLLPTFACRLRLYKVLFIAYCGLTAYKSSTWLGIAVDFFNQLNLLYGSITEFCTPKDCPVMSAGPKYVIISPFNRISGESD